MHDISKVELAAAIRSVPNQHSYNGTIVSFEIAEVLARQIQSQMVEDDHEGVCWLNYLPCHVLDAFANFDSPGVIASYEKKVRRRFPHDITEPSEILTQLEVIKLIETALKQFEGDYSWQVQYLAHRIYAPGEALAGSFRAFVRDCCLNGIDAAIKAERHERGMGATFGDTALRTYEIIGRVMYTFARPIPNATAEHTVSFVADESEKWRVRAGMQSLHAPLWIALDMIDTVRRGWLATPIEKRAEVFKADKHVILDAVAATMGASA